MALTHQHDLSKRTPKNNIKQAVAKSFSKASASYHKLATIQNTIAEFACSKVAKHSGPIVDIGCATGEHSRALGEQVIGVDLALGMVNHANRNYPQGHWINADMESLPFVKDSIGLVFSCMAMQWCTHPKWVLKEVKRVLVPQGQALILVPVDGAFGQLKQAYLNSGLSNRLQPLPNEQSWLDALTSLEFSHVEYSRHTFTDKRDSFIDLLRSISKVGASPTLTHQGGGNGYLTKARLKKLQCHYPTTTAGYELDYHCLLLQLSK